MTTNFSPDFDVIDISGIGAFTAPLDEIVDPSARYGVINENTEMNADQGMIKYT